MTDQTPLGDLTTADEAISLGRLSEVLGVPGTTLRSWEDRHGVGASVRTAGGHRRYTTSDVERLGRMKSFVDDGTPPAAAARIVLATEVTTRPVGRGGHPSPELTGDLSPEVFPAVVLATAQRLDVAGCRTLMRRALATLGVVRGWTELVVPALDNIGMHWSRGELGIESEHMVSHVLAAELRRVALTARPRRGQAKVVLATAPPDQHALPLLALEASLAGHDVEAHVLGAQLPTAALVDAVGTLRPSALFLWSSLGADHGSVDEVERRHPRTRIVLGGPGWGARMTDVVPDLQSAVDRLTGVGSRVRT
ncbi:MAG: cobalamin B12-binding domain-containing protein [Nocardioidaceae bacterium]|nr:cobalamin B12-binding domain-containing protein [Nocardioidaceae bacterium]